MSPAEISPEEISPENSPEKIMNLIKTQIKLQGQEVQVMKKEYDEYTDIIVLVEENDYDVEITITIENPYYWTVEVVKKYSNKEKETLSIWGLGLHYNYYKDNDTEIEVYYDCEPNNPNIEDKRVCTEVEYLIDFIQEILSGKSLLQLAIEELPVPDP